MKLIIIINKEEIIRVKPPKFILNDRVIWILMICLGKLIILEMLDELIQNDELIKINDHKDSNHDIIWAENKVELWSSNEEKMSTSIKIIYN